MTAEDKRVFAKGFTIDGINTNNARFIELLKRRNDPNGENFPWVYTAPTNEIGNGNFAALELQPGTIVGTYT